MVGTTLAAPIGGSAGGSAAWSRRKALVSIDDARNTSAAEFCLT
jgi:hypothetical protein